jgi:hypothetical protein
LVPIMAGKNTIKFKLLQIKLPSKLNVVDWFSLWIKITILHETKIVITLVTLICRSCYYDNWFSSMMELLV